MRLVTLRVVAVGLLAGSHSFAQSRNLEIAITEGRKAASVEVVRSTPYQSGPWAAIPSTPLNPSTEPAAAARKPAHSVESNGHPLRDRLYLLVRQHRLDARLVKLYAAGFCGTEDLRQATRERMQEFVEHLAAEAKNDIDALRQKLEAYQQTVRVPHETSDSWTLISAL